MGEVVTKEKSVPIERVAEKPEKVAKAEKIEDKPEVLEKLERSLARHWRKPFEMMRQMFEWDPFDARFARWFARDDEFFVPEFTVKETKEAFTFKGDIPGIALEDLEVSLTKTRLLVSGHREEEKKEEGETYHTLERSFGSFSRSFALPDGADVEKIAAELKDGVLTITVPKLAQAEATTKKVEVKAP